MTFLHSGGSSWTRISQSSKSLEEAVTTEQSYWEGVLGAPLQKAVEMHGILFMSKNISTSLLSSIHISELCSLHLKAFSASSQSLGVPCQCSRRWGCC